MTDHEGQRRDSRAHCGRRVHAACGPPCARAHSREEARGQRGSARATPTASVKKPGVSRHTAATARHRPSKISSIGASRRSIRVRARVIVRNPCARSRVTPATAVMTTNASVGHRPSHPPTWMNSAISIRGVARNRSARTGTILALSYSAPYVSGVVGSSKKSVVRKGSTMHDRVENSDRDPAHRAW